MKKILYLAAALLMAACSGDKTPASEGSNYFFQDTAEVSAPETDSFDFVQKRGPWEFALQGEYPAGKNEGLARAVREWISELMGGTYEGDLADADALCAHYAERCFDDEDMELTEQLEQDGMECYSRWNIHLQWENDSLATYLLSNEWFGGGAHGSYLVWGATFRKSDGRRFDTDMLKGGQVPNEVLVKGLKAYFEVETDEELVEDLMLPEGSDVSYLPMPTSAPWIEGDGLHLMYQQYEICSYAAGMPAITIPTDQMGQYLTATVRRLMVDD